MKREELDIYLAIQEVYTEVPNPRSDRWVTSELETLCRLVQERMPLDAQFREAVATAWAAYGKSASIDDAGKRIELTCTVARTHGRECFWKQRGKGECSDDVTLGRVDHTRPHSVANCLIECSRHNTARQTKSIDAYLETPGQDGNRDSKAAAGSVVESKYPAR